MVVSLRRSGVSVGAALAFWLANPSLNVATIVFVAFALSWKWAVLRFVAGVVLVFGVAAIAGRLFADERIDPAALPGLDARETGGGSLVARWFSCVARLAVRLLPEYLILVVLLGAARAWLFPAASIAAGNNPLVVAGLALAGALFVIPTAGEVGIVQTLLHLGLGPAGAGALLLTLAPVSLPSIAMLWSSVPRRALAFLFVSTAVVGVGGGYLALALGF